MKDFKLDNYPKINTGFSVPESYFSDLSLKITSQLANQPKVIKFYQKKSNLIMAVAAVLVISLSIPVYNVVNNNNVIITIDDLAYETNINEEEIAEHLTEADFLVLEKNLETSDNNETKNIINDYL